MSLEDDIHDRLVADTDSILQNNLDRVENFFQLHSDGTINIDGGYRDTPPEIQILIYLVGQRYADEGNIADEDTLKTEFFYKRIDRGERTIREYLQNLRGEGLISKEGQSDHKLVVENLPDTLDRIEAAVKHLSDTE